MKTGEYDGAAFAEPRSHPWTRAESSADFRYYDLKSDPSHIRASMEDLLPWTRYAAIERFFVLLEAINGDGSPLETNDCAFSGPHPADPALVKQKLQSTGRIMVLYRTLAENLSPPHILWLNRALHHLLRPIDPAFDGGMIGTTVIPVRYLTLPGDAQAQLGQQLMISFWTWGDTEEEVMQNLERLMKNLSQALAEVIAEIVERVARENSD